MGPDRNSPRASTAQCLFGAPRALRGCKLKDLVEEGLRLVFETSREPRHHSLAELMKRASGSIESGISDLASDPEHLI